MLISIAPLYQNQSGDVVKELLLIIYVDFRGTTIAKSMKHGEIPKAPDCFSLIEHGLELCPAKYYFNRSKTDLRQRLQRLSKNSHARSLICILFC